MTDAAAPGSTTPAAPAGHAPAAPAPGRTASAPRTAAYLDLDKTVLATSTTFALGTPMHRSGLISTTALARGVVAQLPYLLLGADEDHTSRLMDQLAALNAGVERSRLQEVVADAMGTAIEPAVYAEALDLIEGHHRAGHDVVIVSASVIEIVEPIAALVGADRAVATRLETAGGGRFTGRIEHSLLHGAKVEALEADAAEHGIDLARSWAYSDSISDRPMLEAVGHPVAVNPDRELRRLASELDWPVRDFERPVNLRNPFQPTIPRPNLPPVRAIPSTVLPLRWELAVNVGLLAGVGALTATAAGAVSGSKVRCRR